jgi:hypothetical protein
VNNNRFEVLEVKEKVGKDSVEENLAIIPSEPKDGLVAFEVLKKVANIVAKGT